jgi:hypothetical protein
MPTMRTSTTFAKWVVDTGKDLVQHYYGENWDLETGMFYHSEVPIQPVEELVPRESAELIYWVNGALMFIKTVTRLFSLRLEEQHEIDILLNMDINEIDEV